MCLLFLLPGKNPAHLVKGEAFMRNYAVQTKDDDTKKPIHNKFVRKSCQAICFYII
jgi:hypothetical protein